MTHTYNLRVGPLKVLTPGITYQDMGKVLKIRTRNIDTLESAIAAIADPGNYDNVPTLVSLDGNYLLNSDVSAKKIVTTVQTVLDINVLKFGGARRHRVSILVGEPLPITFAEELKEAGAVSLIPKISVHGFDSCIDANQEFFKHGEVWPSYLIDHNIKHKSSTNYNIALTQRQQQIADLIVRRGLSNKQIARHCGISESTVKLHIGIVLKKYGIQNRTQISIAMK